MARSDRTIFEDLTCLIRERQEALEEEVAFEVEQDLSDFVRHALVDEAKSEIISIGESVEGAWVRCSEEMSGLEFQEYFLSDNIVVKGMTQRAFEAFSLLGNSGVKWINGSKVFVSKFFDEGISKSIMALDAFIRECCAPELTKPVIRRVNARHPTLARDVQFSGSVIRCHFHYEKSSRDRTPERRVMGFVEDYFDNIKPPIHHWMNRRISANQEKLLKEGV